MLYRYDLEFDESLPTQMRNRKAAYLDFFKEKDGKSCACI